MLAEGLAMQKTLLQEDPEGYPEVMSLREPIQPQRGENCVVCVHARRKRGDDYPVEVLVEWSSPPPPSPRLTWILLSEARRLAPPEVSIFEARERDGGPANARERKYRSNAGAAEEAARASAAEVAELSSSGRGPAEAPPVHPEGLVDPEDGDEVEPLGDDERVVEGLRGSFAFRNVADAPSDSPAWVLSGVRMKPYTTMYEPDKRDEDGGAK
jgi:hypothetical protein